MSSKQYGLSIKLNNLDNLSDKEIFLRVDKAIGLYEKPETSFKYKKPETYIKIEIKNKTSETSIL